MKIEKVRKVARFLKRTTQEVLSGIGKHQPCEFDLAKKLFNRDCEDDNKEHLFLTWLRLCTTVDQARMVHYSARTGVQMHFALNKCLLLCTTAEQARTLYGLRGMTPQMEERIARKHMRLSVLEIKKAKTRVQAQLAYRHAPDGDMRAVAQEKYLRISLRDISRAKTPEDVKGMIDGGSLHPKASTKADQKLAALIMKEALSTRKLERLKQLYSVSDPDTKPRLTVVERIAELL